MIRLAFALAALSVTAWAAEPQPTNCELHVAASLEFQTIPDGRVTVPVKVEGHDYRMLVDTGGYIDTLSQEVVRREGYKPRLSQGTTMQGMGNTYMDHYVTVKEFTIGHSRGEDFKFFVDDVDSLFFDGILAPEILGGYDADLDFAHDKLNLFRQDHCPGRVVYWTKAPVATVPMAMQGSTHISVPVTMDGKEIDALLDTGAHTSFITMRTAKRYLGLDEKDPQLKLRGNMSVNGMIGPVYTYPFKSLSFGAVTVTNPHIEIVADKVWDENKLLLGVGILRQIHMYIAYKERMLYLSPAQQN